VEDGVELLSGDVAQHRIVALVPLLAGDRREAQLFDEIGRRGAVRKWPIGLSSSLRTRTGTSSAGADGGRPPRRAPSGRAPAAPSPCPPARRVHALVGGDPPAHADGAVRHAAADQRIGGEARPQHDAVRRRVARRDAERERIGAERRCGEQRVAGDQRERDGAGGGLPRQVEQASAVDRAIENEAGHARAPVAAQAPRPPARAPTAPHDRSGRRARWMRTSATLGGVTAHHRIGWVPRGQPDPRIVRSQIADGRPADEAPASIRAAGGPEHRPGRRVPDGGGAAGDAHRGIYQCPPDGRRHTSTWNPYAAPSI
jgi:hypothetical protein